MLGAQILVIVVAALGQTADLTHVDTFTDSLQYPGRVAATGGGGIYVTDPPNNAIIEYDGSGVAQNTFSIPEEPLGIAVGTGGEIFVSLADGTVGRYDGTFALQELLDPTPATLVGPNDMAIDSTNNELYVVDGAGHQVLVFADPGTGWEMVRSWGTQGSGLLEFQSPLSIAVDSALGRILVTDADNFRVQVFDTTGISLFKFGYRIAYTTSGDLAWVARAAGIAVDSCSNVYVSDALMGTIRVFDEDGTDLDILNPPVGFGTAAGQLRVPCDVMIDSDTLYAASTSNAAVEVYSIACTPAPMPGRNDAYAITAAGRIGARGTVVTPTLRTPRGPDNPFDLTALMNSGGYERRYDLNLDRRIDMADLKIAVREFGVGTVNDFLTASGPAPAAPLTTFEGPHIVEDLPNQCGRCHSMDGMPLGIEDVDGQMNLCLSCHTAAGLASGMPFTEPARTAAHPYGIAADSGGSRGPDPDSASEMALHLDNGNIRCGTCHNQHTYDQGEPYGLRRL